MANVVGTNDNEWVSYSGGTSSVKGSPTTTGSDHIDMKGGNDQVWSGAGNDIVYGGAGNDKIDGGAGDDKLYGGAGEDTLKGNFSDDKFYFNTKDTGDVYAGQADTITDFTDSDQIFLKGSYTDAGNTSAPGEGQYSIWQKGTDWVVTYNSTTDSGFHDIVVKGGDPHGDISFY